MTLAYAYWTLDESWLVNGSSLDGHAVAQFGLKPSRRIAKAIDAAYRDGKKSNTVELMRAENSWHHKQKELV